MSAIDRLSDLLRELPGIGPRQAKRLVYYIRGRNQAYAQSLINALSHIHHDISVCERCFRMHSRQGALCSICSDSNRDATNLMIVSRDADLEAMERSGAYRGLYFVLGGSIPILDRRSREHVRIDELITRVQTEYPATLKEVIFALNATPEGEHTENIIRETLAEALQNGLRATRLGRGISTGLELEYTDTETLKAALFGRKSDQS